MNQDILDKFSKIRLEIESQLSPYSHLNELQIKNNLEIYKFFATDFNYITLDIVDKIELADFELYCIDAITEEKIVYPAQDYTLLSVKNKIVIAFHDSRKFTPKTYLYAEYNGAKSLIQVSLFEDMQRFFHMGKDHTWGSFVFMGSRIVEQSDNNALKMRCDVNDYGPIFWNENGETNTDGNHNEFSQTVDITRLQDFLICMSVPSAGHIVYLRLKPIDGTLLSDSYNNEAIVPAVTRTIFELMKLIYEWSLVSQEPFNNTQQISTKAKSFIDGLNIPQPIAESIKSLQTDMQVYRYLAGSENARQRPPLEEVALMPQFVYDWFKQQFCYRSFENLILYHPIFNEETQ
jgi:hypothetical protein